MKMVFSTRPAMITPKKMMPSTSGTTCRQWKTIQVMLRKIAEATRQAHQRDEERNRFRAAGNAHCPLSLIHRRRRCISGGHQQAA